MTPPARPDTERVWLQCMISALGGLATLDVEFDSAEADWHTVNGRHAEHAAKIADAAVKEWRERYPAENRTAR